MGSMALLNVEVALGTGSLQLVLAVRTDDNDNHGIWQC